MGVSSNTSCYDLIVDEIPMVVLSDKHLLTVKFQGDYCVMSMMSSVESSDDANE